MKKLSHLTCFTVFFAFFTTFGINAQITIGNGTAYSEKYPINGYYNYSWSNTIYLKTQINTSGSLNSIAFYVDNSTANLTMNNQKIYVRHTTATGYSSTAYEGPTGFTEVFSGDITISGQGWKTITFTTPFNYNGDENLEFLFENRDGSYVTSFPYYRYTSAGSGNNRTRRDYQDAQFPSSCYTCALSSTFPNIQLNITPCSFDSGTTAASPSTVIPGNTSTISVTGEEPGSSYQWQSSTDNISFSNISGATSNSYEATIFQTKYYRVLVTNAGCSKLSTTTTLTADVSSMTTKSIGTGTTLSEKYPFNNYYDYSWSNMIYTASEIGHSGLLSRVSFSVATLPANLTALNQKIYVRHTSANPAFTTNTYPGTTGFIKVFEGTINYTATGWLEVVFDNQFYYNGTDNLEFLFENRDGSYTLDYPVFHSTIMSDTRTRRDYQDVSFPTACNYCNRVTNLMNIQMKFFPCTNTAGTASTTNANLCTNTSTTIDLAGQTSGSTIQWQSSTDNTTFTNVSGATSASYNTPNLTQTTYYRAIATSNLCQATSNVVTINVSSATAGTVSATNATICSGNFSILNLSGQTVGSTIQWQSSSDNTNFTDLNGQTAPACSTGVLISTTYYRAKVTNVSCTVYSNSQTITVNTVTAGTASVTNATVLPFGSSAVSVTGQTPSSTIQWQSSTDNTNFTNISGATNGGYEVLNIVQTTYYKAIITSPEGCVGTTNTVTVTVNESSVTTKSIGTGTNVFDKYPFNGYYDFSWATMLYKAAEINTTGKLTKVSFYVENSPVNEVMNNQKIYVRHTSTSEYADDVYPTTTEFTLVYDGTITYNGSGWKEITLQTPFDYNGVEDLEFLFENRDGSWTSTYPTFRGQSGMPENRVKRDYQDGSFPATCSGFCGKYNNILNIQMKFLPCTIAAGSIVATQTTVKPTNNIEVILTNQEVGATIQWEQSDDNYNFKVIAAQTGSTLATPMTIKPLYIKAVSKTTCSSHSNIVTINPDNCFVPITSTGTGTSVTEKYPFDVYYNNSWSSTIYTQPEIGSAGTITSLSFKIANAPDNYVTHNQKIYVRETTADDYPTTDYPTTTGFTLVYDGSVIYRGSGWKEFVLTTPFAYNGTSNLEFLFKNEDGSYGYDYPTFEYTSGMSTYRTKRDYDDAVFPETCVNCGRAQNIPNVKFKFQVPSTIAGTAVATETEICEGKNTTLSLNDPITGSTIQWKKSTDNNTFTIIDGATYEVYITPNLEATTYYKAEVTVGSCTTTSNIVTVAVEGSCTTAISTFNGESETGEVMVDIASVVDKIGPYHYIISENVIPNFSDIYEDIKTNVYEGVLDMNTFYQSGNVNTSFTFSDLTVGQYFVSVFDSRGTRIYDKQISIQPVLSFESNSGLTGNGTSVVSLQNNSKGTTEAYITESTQASMKFVLSKPTKTQFYGLLSTEVTITDKTSLQYGFNVVDGKVYTIENGVQSTTYTVATPNMELVLKQIDGNLKYYVGGQEKHSVVLPTTTYTLKSGFGFEKAGVLVHIGFTKFKFKKYAFKPNFENSHCEGSTSFSFNVRPTRHYSGSLTYTYNVNSTNGFTTSGTGYTLGTNPVISCPIGVYIVSGIITLPSGSTPSTISFSETVYVGYATAWEQKPTSIEPNYYEYYPNSYSLKHTPANFPAAALSKNKVTTDQTGWVMFTPVLNGSTRSSFSLTSSNTTFPANYSEVVLEFNKFQNQTMLNWKDPITHQPTMLGLFPLTTKFYLKINESTISVNTYNEQTGVLHQIVDYNRPSTTLWMKGNSYLNGNGFLDVISSFACGNICNLAILKSPDKTTYCVGELIQLNVINLDGLPLDQYQFSWTPVTDISCTGCQSPVVYPSISTTYNFDLYKSGDLICRKQEAAGSLITLGECTVTEENNTFEQIGCSFGNYGAGVYVSGNTKLNVYCNVLNELAVTSTGLIEGGQFTNKGEITSTKNWSNNGQNEMFMSYEGQTNLQGGYQQIGGTSSIHYNELKLTGSDKKEIYNDEFVESKLELTDRELAAKNSTLYLRNTDLTALTRTTGFISTNESGGNFDRSINTSVLPYLFPMGSTLNTYRYRPLEVKKSNNGDNFKVHFENNFVPASLNVQEKSPNVLSVNDKYYYKIVSSSVSNDLSVTAYFDPSDGNFQAISHWTDNNESPTSSWWGSTPGIYANQLPSTDPNTYGLLAAGTVGLQSFDSENFSLSQAGFYINSENFGNPTDENDSDGDGIPDDVDVTTTGGADTDNDGIDDTSDASVTGGSDLDGDGIDDSTDSSVDGGTIVLITSSTGNTGGGLGDPAATGIEDDVYTPTPVAGTYTIDVTPGNCGIAGTIEFTVLSSGQIESSSVKYYPNGATSAFVLSKDLFSLDQPNSGLILNSTPKDILESCVNSIQIEIGNGITKFSLIPTTGLIKITKPSLITFGSNLKIYNASNVLVSEKNLAEQNVTDISLNNASDLLWVIEGTYKFEFDVNYDGLTQTVKGQFIIK